MINALNALKAHIIKIAAEPRFIHHAWFVDHHLSIVEQISLELCDIYPQADRDVVLCLVWLHDLGKIITNKQGCRDQEVIATVEESKKLLKQFGFGDNFSKVVCEYLMAFDYGVLDKPDTPVEVKIVSSADGCSHLVGPFFSLYWYENSQLSVGELLTSNQKKLDKDWDKKIVLPEAKQAFEQRYNYLREHILIGRPKKYL